jgi:transposase
MEQVPLVPFVLNSNRCLSTRSLKSRGSYPTSMSQNNTILHLGLDVAKLSLQLHLINRFHSLTNDAKGHRQLLKLLRDHPKAHVICEATGGYEQKVVRCLQSAGIAVSVVEAGRVRYFARAQGLRAKTDPIDAAVLSAYGRTFSPAVTAAPSARQQRLSSVTQRRRQLVQLLLMQRNYAEHYSDPFQLRQARQLIKTLEKQIDECEQAISQLIAEDDVLRKNAQRLQSISGVGPIVAATVLAEMPELGQISNNAAAALAGVAPYNDDSGDQKGKRRIAGGRRTVRNALYMATLSAVRYDRILKACYQRLCANGKAPLVALTACMRKLVVLMNRLLKNAQFQLAA